MSYLYVVESFYSSQCHLVFDIHQHRSEKRIQRLIPARREPISTSSFFFFFLFEGEGEGEKRGGIKKKKNTSRRKKKKKKSRMIIFYSIHYLSNRKKAPSFFYLDTDK